jgi:very-short-patch-repair endonuclease
MDTLLPLGEVLRRQHQVITRRQALECGIGHDTIHRRALPGGRWQRLLPGVYLTVTGTPTIDQRDMAALLYAGPGSTLTGPAALRRHGMRELQSAVVDVLIPASRVRQTTGFVLLHQTRRLPPMVCYEGPIQYALAARAVADAARAMKDLRNLRAVVAAAVQTRRCTVEQLEAELHAGPMHGSALLRTALGEVAQGTRSAPEAELFDLIKHGRLPVPIFNPSLYVGQELLAKPDAWWPDNAVAVEVDSRQWHLGPDSWEETMRRDARMTALGISVLHFSPRQIRQEPDEVLTRIRRTLASRRGISVPSIRTVIAA